jgi:hypothetical protein
MFRHLKTLPLLAMLAVSSFSAPGSPSPASPGTITRVLFVGNSFTYYNGGLETHVQKLAATLQSPLTLHCDRATKGGATLKILHDLESVHEKIRTGHYDVVVLQEDLPELKEHQTTPFLEQARLFNQEIQAAGASTAFFMAWPYERLNWITLDQIEKAHREIARELNTPVAPVGLAFQRALLARAELPMLGPDKEHETIHGTYLAACVIVSTLFHSSPVGAAYHPEGVSPGDAAFLQAQAWNAVQAWNTGP